MPYNLVRLAPGSFDVLLNGTIVASLVRSADSWTAELLLELPPEERPAPFLEMEHTFGSLEEAQTWLGIAEISDAGGQG